jgi:hypothetical protein
MREWSSLPVLIYCSRMAPYSSWPAVSRTSSNATSSSMMHCFLYESSVWSATGERNGMKEAYRLLDRILEGSVAVHLLSGIRDLLVNELVVSFELTSDEWRETYMWLDKLDCQSGLSDTYHQPTTQSSAVSDTDPSIVFHQVTPALE